MAKQTKTATEQEVNDFVEMFTRIKEEHRKKPCKVVGLSDKNNKKLKTLLNRGFGPEDFEAVMRQMYKDTSKEYPKGWAWETGNDTPAHMLWEETFERYLNKAEQAELKKAEELEEKDNRSSVDPKGVVSKAIAEASEQKRVDVELIKSARAAYTKALAAGEWSGRVLEAAAIVNWFTKSFEDEERQGFKLEAKRVVETGEYLLEKRTGLGSLGEAMDRMARKYEVNVMAELAIREAVKRKIPEPWK